MRSGRRGNEVEHLRSGISEDAQLLLTCCEISWSNGGVVALCYISRFIETSTPDRNNGKGDQMPLLGDIETRLSFYLVGIDSRLCLVLCVSWKELLVQLDIGRGWGKRIICRLG
jgi:hypothetical protein